MNKLLEQVGEWQEILEQRGFYEIDAVIERTASGLGLTDIGLIEMLQSSVVVNVQRFYLLNYY